MGHPPEVYTYIYGAARTPIGKFLGSLAEVPAVDLGALALQDALKRSSVPPEAMGEVILGNVLSAGLGQNPARQAARGSGLADAVGATTVNKVCGSGLKAVMLADQAVRLGEAEFVLAGGMESMSQAPFLLPDFRRSRRLGHGTLIDSLIHDGLCDRSSGRHMGEIAEALAQREAISRTEQDDYARLSYQRARAAQKACWFSKEIVAVPVPRKKGKQKVTRDEMPDAFDLDRLADLPPAFVKEGGTVTAGNSSSINDGAAALVVGRHDPKRRPLARLCAQAAHAQAPEEFPLAPVGAITRLLERWGLGLDDVDLFEINEAFAVTTLAVCRRLGLALEKVNIHGGAVALGHPIGASGARILVTLLNALAIHHKKYGVAALCLGGGEAVAVGVEYLQP